MMACGISYDSNPLQINRSASQIAVAIELPINLGRVFKIPPTHKRSTASNINFEQSGEFNLHFTLEPEFNKSESCNPTPNGSSVSLGVKSLPPTAGYMPGETIPLLSPTMEKELMKESWSFPGLCNSNMAEESTIHSIWEEDYQDLSDWCIDTFHNQCVFHIGESKAMIHSGMKSGDISLSTDIIGDVIDNGGTDDISTIITIDETLQSSNHETTILSVDNKTENNGGKLDLPEAWLGLPQSSIAVRTDEWVQLIDSQNENKSLQQIAKIENSNFDTENNRQETWDVINTGSNAFDLLSYLCDDNTQTPGNMPMKDTACVSQKGTVIQSIIQAPKMNTRLQGRRGIKIIDKKSQTISSSNVSSPIDVEYDAEPSSSSTRHSRTIATKRKKENAKLTPRKKKPTIESDSDDLSSNYSYKESREKNNEASRKSRMNKKTKEKEMISKADELERDNRLLKIRVEQLDKMVTSMRAAILRSALKKSN